MASHTGLFAEFRRFRWTRPFWAGVWILLAGLIIAWLPLGPITDVITAGFAAWSGILLGLVLVGMALFIWFRPETRHFAAAVALIAAFLSYPLSNLGGFMIGMFSAIIGACLAFAWIPDKQPVPAGKEAR